VRFGIATCDITPREPIHLSGFCQRRDVFDAVNDPVTFTALVLEESGRRMVLGAGDLLNFPADGRMGDWLERAGAAADCPPENVLLNASHTHGGPLIAIPFRCFREMYGPAEEAYGRFLLERVVEAVRNARERLAEGTLWYAEGKTDFPRNRRRREGGRTILAPNPAGPTDDRLQIFVLKDASDEVAAVALKMACHPVTTGAQHRVTADFPGAWREAVRDALGEGVTPIFFQGAGADANPRQFEKDGRCAAQPYDILPSMGRELCTQMLRALVGKVPAPVTGLSLSGEIRSVRAPCERRYTDRAALQPLLEQGDVWQREYAAECLRRLDSGEAIPDYNEYRVQTVRLNRDFVIVGLDAEPLCALGLAVERAVAPARGIVLGYTNGYSGYAPDSAELQRGGYETETYLHHCWSGPLKPGLERLLSEAAAESADVR